MTFRIENAAYMDLAAREQWLAAQAARGWYPAGSFFPIWRMKKGPPRTLRYALTPRRDSGALSPEVRALYQQAGWTYVRDAGEFRLFAAEDPAAPPVFTDDDSLACSLRGMERRLWWATTAAGLLLAAVLAALLLPGMTLLRLVSVPVLGWLMLLVSPFQLGAQWRDLHRARRGVRQGGAYRFPGPRPGRRTLLRNICTWLLPLAAAYMLLAGGLLFPRQQSLPGGGTLPRIEELTGTPGAQPPEGRGDTLRRQLPTLLCPVQLTATQYAYDPPAGGGTVWAGQVLDMQYVHLAIPAMAGPVVRGWLSSRWGGDAWQVQEGDCPGTDLVLLVRSRDTGECPAAAITCGGRAVMYEASDGIDLSGSLPLLARPVLEGRPIG